LHDENLFTVQTPLAPQPVKRIKSDYSYSSMLSAIKDYVRSSIIPRLLHPTLALLSTGRTKKNHTKTWPRFNLQKCRTSKLISRLRGTCNLGYCSFLKYSSSLQYSYNIIVQRRFPRVLSLAPMFLRITSRNNPSRATLEGFASCWPVIFEPLNP